METAERLISRLRPVLAAAVDPQDPQPPGEPILLHAEVLHQMCTADGLMELLDWSRQGLGADPLACMWLGSLRWYRLITGSYPEHAPQPPARPLDQALTQLSRQGGFTARTGSGMTSLRGLSQGQMAYPSAPAQPESTDSAVLLRAVPIGLVPYIDAPMRRSWVRQAVALTHGHPELTQRAEELADLVHRLAGGPPAEALPESAAQQQAVLSAGLDDDVAAILDRQLRAAAGAAPAAASAHTEASAPAPDSPRAEAPASASASAQFSASSSEDTPISGAPLGGSESTGELRTIYDVIEELAQDWEEVTRAR
ncbi:ADP-ribosylglycohydrolase family protein [Nesterenkonia sp. E16_10]|uniref:ADP-ribosylglycohydrolase family protein n=1 Tax=Nesterenkonia sp. E16_10 TaxID=2789296 RepID=UPI001A914229|nr:ADP-ribosylglycohydrolase family protein [Nesterenkonia sp. E16_10]